MKNESKNQIFREIISSLSDFFQEVNLLEQLSNSFDDNLSYRMILDGKDSVLKVYCGNDKERILSDLNLQNFLYNQGLPCPKIIPLFGNLLLKNRDSYYTLYKFIPGEPIKYVNMDNVSKIFNVLKKLYEVGKTYLEEIPKKSLMIPQIEEGSYKKEFEDMLILYTSLNKSINKEDTLIHGDIHFDNILKSSKGEFFLLDLEHIKRGDFLEDLANIIFYSACNTRNPFISPRELIDIFFSKYHISDLDSKILKDRLLKVSLRYGLGSIWQFNRGFINQTEVDKRFKMINRA